MSCRRGHPITHGVLGAALGGAVLAALLAPSAQAQHPASAPAPPAVKTGAQIYREACASCHGTDGTGSLASQVGFDVELPDFSDCSFASREPSADWFSVAHQGGPTRVFDEIMPAFGDALSKQELESAVSHIKTFCDDDSWPPGELNLPRALLTEKAYVEDELVLELGSTIESPVEVDGKIIFETRLGARGQFELVVPFGVREREAGEYGPDDEGGVSEGIGDIAVGGKYVLVHSLDTGSIFSVAGELFFPTGDELDGYGIGTFKFEPFLAYGQIIPVVGFVQLQGGAELPFETDRAEIEFFARGALGKTFFPGRFGRAMSPMVELDAKWGIEDEIKVNWSVVPQLQLALSQRQHVLWNVGVKLPLNDIDSRGYTVLTYLLWDWFDGGFFEGW